MARKQQHKPVVEVKPLMADAQASEPLRPVEVPVSRVRGYEVNSIGHMMQWAAKDSVANADELGVKTLSTLPQFGRFDVQLVAELLLSLPPHRSAALGEWLSAHAAEASEGGNGSDHEQDIADLIALLSVPTADELVRPIDAEE